MMDAETLIACLYIKGFGKTEALSEALGEPAEAVDAVLTELIAGGNAEQTRVGARLSAQGMGKDQPIMPNDTDAGRAANRRVEFHIQGRDTPQERSP